MIKSNKHNFTERWIERLPYPKTGSNDYTDKKSPQEGIIERNPDRDYRKPKRQNSEKVRYLTKTEIAKVEYVLKQTDSHNLMALCIIKLLLLTGYQYRELAALRFEDIDFDNQCINFKFLGLDKRIHDFRQTFASAVAEAGKNPQIVSALLGHSNGSMTDYYTHFAKEELVKAADEVSAIIYMQLGLSGDRRENPDKVINADSINDDDTEVSAQMELPFLTPTNRRLLP